MSRPPIPQEGQCRCGAIHIRITAPPMLTMACHCTGCQRMSSSAFSLSAAIPTPGFAVIKGEPVIGGLHGKDVHHYFCGYCMTWMFTRAEGMDSFVNVRSTLMDYPETFAPFIETYTSEKLPWVSTSATHSFAKFPAMEDYGALIGEYAQQANG
jgi:hypothetical protein